MKLDQAVAIVKEFQAAWNAPENIIAGNEVISWQEAYDIMYDCRYDLEEIGQVKAIDIIYRSSKKASRKFIEELV